MTTGIRIFDISDPSAPFEETGNCFFLNDGKNESEPPRVVKIKTFGERLYVILVNNNQHELRVYDLDNPSFPFLLKSYFIDDREAITDFEISNGTVYLALSRSGAHS